jgi:nicotinate-nucleotide pyrophosphorylase (carboxylating)
MIPDSQVEAWLREDLGYHDVTNDVPGDTKGRLVATEPGVAAGLDAAAAVFEYLDCDVTPAVDAGDRIDPDDDVLRVTGPARDILRAERVAVNVAGHASGIASETWVAVEAAREANPDVAIAATRKTTPGLRGIDKRAVAAGGGDTHRLDLSHMVMVKDNHVAELGLEAAVERFEERTSFATQVEVEVEDSGRADAAVAAGADAVLFDNLPSEEVAVGVASVPDDVITEASGGITYGDVRAYARTGVDVISMGWLTHSAPALDYSFRTG